MATEISTWQDLAKAKLNAINESIPEKWRLSSIPSIEEQRDVTGPFIRKYLSTEEVEITETDAVNIVEKTSAGIWTAEEVTTAFCHRASLAHQLTSCLHETFFQAAIEDAKYLDKYYAQHKAPIGPLHGLPISLKDQFHVKGVETTMGYTGWINTFEGKRGTGKEKVFESEMVKERCSTAKHPCLTLLCQVKRSITSLDIQRIRRIATLLAVEVLEVKVLLFHLKGRL